MSKILLLVAVIAVIQTAFAEEAVAGAYVPPGSLVFTLEQSLKSPELPTQKVAETFVSQDEANRQKREAIAKVEKDEEIKRQNAIAAALAKDLDERAHKASCSKAKQDCNDEEPKEVDRKFNEAIDTWNSLNKTHVEIDVPAFSTCTEKETSSSKATEQANADYRTSTEKCISHSKTFYEEAKNAKKSKCSELETTFNSCNDPKKADKASWESAQKDATDFKKKVDKAEEDLKLAKEASKTCTDFNKENKCGKEELQKKEDSLKTLKEDHQIRKNKEEDARKKYESSKCEQKEKDWKSCIQEHDVFVSCNNWSDRILGDHDDLVSLKLENWKSSCTSPSLDKMPEKYEFETAQKAITETCLADAGKLSNKIANVITFCDYEPETIESLQSKLKTCNAKILDSESKTGISSIISSNWKVLTGALIFFFTAFWFIGSGHSEEAPRKSKAAAPVEADSAEADEDESAGSDAPSTTNKGSRKRSSTPSKKK